MNILYFDLLRILATFAVIFLHVSACGFGRDYLSCNWIVSVVYDGMVRWCVPIFVMLSGALFLDMKKKTTLESLIKKRIFRLLSAYIFWCVVYIIFRGIIHLWKFGTLDCSWSMMLYPHFHLWFLPMLMGVYIFIPFLKSIVCDLNIVCYGLIVWLLFLLGKVFLGGMPQIGVLFNGCDIIGYIGYFVCGYFISIYNFNKEQKIIVYVLGILGMIITITGTLFLSILEGKPNVFLFDYLNLNVTFTSIAIFIFCRYNCYQLNDKIVKFINYVRKDLFGIYLIHIVYISILCRPIFMNLCNYIISIPIIALMVFVLSLYSVKIMRKIPVFKKFVE